ncbi:MAG: FAD:protein FMN transferase [Spirochaetes bacterium]|nr:FAD:protein FMN transferase [Spirochaetota bacterium]MBU0955393.1 FAD:protein FMN transferase [Spirochaetota bacterium]
MPGFAPKRQILTRSAAITILLIAAILSISLSCSKTPAGPLKASDFALNTVCTITLIEGGSQQIMNDAFARLHALEQILSARQDDSSLMQVNKAAGIHPVAVEPELFAVIEKALEYARLSQGNFDPTIDPLSRLWDIQGGTERVPEPEEIQLALSFINAGDVILDPQQQTVFLARSGMSLDLGAIAKGYAADELSKLLLAGGVKAAIVDLGGNIVTIGSKPDGSPWRIAIKNPVEPDQAYLGLLSLPGSNTMVTSGIYERYFFGDDGQRYHHILSTEDGYPVDNGVISVTIISRSSIDADALSTSLLAMGIESGLALAESLTGIDAVFVDQNRKLYASSGVKDYFVLQNPDFSWSE